MTARTFNDLRIVMIIGSLSLAVGGFLDIALVDLLGVELTRARTYLPFLLLVQAIILLVILKPRSEPPTPDKDLP